MTQNNIKLSGGILLVRSKSGTSKIKKVLVETKPGKTKNEVKCRLQKFEDKRRPSKIPVLIKTRKWGLRKNENLKNSLHLLSKKVQERKLIKTEASKLVVASNGSSAQLPNGKGDFLKNVQSVNDQNCKANVYEEVDEIVKKYEESTTPITPFQKEGFETDSKFPMNIKSEDPKLVVRQYSSSLHSLNGNEESGITLFKNEGFTIDQNYESSRALSTTNMHENLRSQNTKSAVPIASFQKPKFEIEQNCNDKSSKEDSNYTNSASPNDSTIHITVSQYGDFEDDDDECECDDEVASETSIQEEPMTKLQAQKVVMAQYNTAPGAKEDDESSSDEPEDFDADQESIDSDDSFRAYIDSGLRRLKSEESRLYLQPLRYRSKKTVPIKEDDGVTALLQEIPSEIFNYTVKKPKKKQSSKKLVRTPTLPIGHGDYVETSEEDFSKSSPTEGSDIMDTGPLAKLKELEDTTYIIDVDEFSQHGDQLKKLSDFCLHNREPPESDGSSISTIEQPVPKEFCVHTYDVLPESDGSSMSTIEQLTQNDSYVYTNDGDFDKTSSLESTSKSLSSAKKSKF